ncbi:MAG: ABC-2 family transporter protein [Chloroflexota bacterium]|nr:ABC-2 family transporter protein [Chloroflexota bacterium]
MIGVYRALAVQQIQIMLQYRVATFLYALFSFVRPIIFLAAWLSVAASQGGRLGSFQRSDLAAYYALSILVTHLTTSFDFFEFEWEVRQGRLSPKLLRPLHPLHYAIVNNVLWKVVTAAMVIPVAVLVALTFGARFHVGPIDIVLGTVSVVLGAALSFVFGWVVASAAFWTTRVQALVHFYQRTAFIFAGQIAPLALLPGPLSAIAYALPFGYMLGVPTDILRGAHDVTTSLLLIAAQAVWLLVAAVLYRIVWNAGLREYSAVGA